MASVFGNVSFDDLTVTSAEVFTWGFVDAEEVYVNSFCSSGYYRRWTAWDQRLMNTWWPRKPQVPQARKNPEESPGLEDKVAAGRTPHGAIWIRGKENEASGRKRREVKRKEG